MTSGIRNAKEFLKSKELCTEKARSVKLPNISLKKFNGNPLEWPAFWDLFKTSIDDRRDIGESAKFYYLISQLEGDAALLLAEFDHTRESYVEAVQLLKQTYGKTKLLIQARLHAILDIEPLKPNHMDLGRFRSQYEAHIRGLKSLGANVVESGYIYAAILLRKLPRRVADNINRASTSDTWSLDELRGAIEKEIDHLRAAEETEPIGSSAMDFHRKGELMSTISYANNSSQNNANNSNLNYSKSNSVKKFSCAFCAGEHSYFNCTMYTNPISRKERVSKLGLCYNCLRINHSVKNCRISNVCRNCGKKHHTIICSQNNGKTLDGVSSDNFDIENCKNETVMTISEPNSIPIQKGENSSILPTATMLIPGNHGSEVVSRCLFDTGAQNNVKIVIADCIEYWDKD